jgi:predicted RNA-binding protein
MRTYWVSPSTLDIWIASQQAGSYTIGFRNRSRGLAQRIKAGDYLLQYLTRLQRWIGILEVTSEADYDDSPRFQGDEFPWRVKVRVVVQLTPDTAIPLSDLKSQLTIYQNPRAVGNYLRRSPTKLSETADGERLVAVISSAANDALMAQVAKGRLGQGYGPSSEQRQAIETRAMEEAKKYFRAQGWTVEDVSSTERYDLRCTRRGKELRVEVKGATSDGKKVLLTRAEVNHARDSYLSVALFILANVRLAPTREGRPTPVGGDRVLYQPWRVDDGSLSPVAFDYVCPALGEA